MDVQLDSGNTAWILTATAVVLFMTLPGLALFYGGSGLGNLGSVVAEETPWHDHPSSLTLTLPPLATLVLMPEEG